MIYTGDMKEYKAYVHLFIRIKSAKEKALNIMLSYSDSVHINTIEMQMCYILII